MHAPDPLAAAPWLRRHRHSAGFLLVYAIIAAGMLVATGSGLYPWLVWNAILATLPAVFAHLFADRLAAGRRTAWLAVGWGVLWLLFWPNTFYLLTDVIHLSGTEFYSYDPGGQYGRSGSGWAYSTDIRVWASLLVTGMGVFYGLLMGVESYRVVHDALIPRIGRAASAALTVVASGLCALGLFIGRFLRLNSWDALNPAGVLAELGDAVGRFMAMFLVIATGFVLVLLWLYLQLCADRRDPVGGAAYDRHPVDPRRAP